MAQEVYESTAKYRFIDIFTKSRYQRQVEGAEITVQAAHILHGTDKQEHRSDKADDFVKYKANMLPKNHDAQKVANDMEKFTKKARRWNQKIYQTF